MHVFPFFSFFRLSCLKLVHQSALLARHLSHANALSLLRVSGAVTTSSALRHSVPGLEILTTKEVGLTRDNDHAWAPTYTIGITPMWALVIIIMLGGALQASAQATDAHPNEHSICGFKEGIAFWAWQHASGKNVDVPVGDSVSKIDFVTSDQRKLSGFRIGSTQGKGPENARGALLVAQGNAMLASQLVEELARFASTGLDVFVYDYRGYGLSQGKARLRALISDYRELMLKLASDGYKKTYLYGLSIGGMVLVNSTAGLTPTRLVLDSSPSRVENFGCPAAIDPVTVLPANATNILVLAGALDRVIPLKNSEELRDAVTQRGGESIVGGNWGHPFTDPPEEHERRMRAIETYLSDGDPKQ